ncbi:MAG: MFS transporter [Bacteroidota bacterium]|nr:MFS transporter [Bacteroidota bacterium]
MRSTRLVFFCACLGMLLFGISLITLGSVAPALREKFQLDAIASGTLFSILPIGILAGSLLFGPFSDRYGYKVILTLSCLFILAGFQGIAYASSLGILKICIFLFGFGGGAINGATNAVVSDISEKNKGGNLSLLGVFYAVGALGMPSVLGLLEERFSFEAIVSVIGYIPLAVAVLCLFTRFPLPKQAQGIPLSKGVGLLREGVLIAIGFFLFCLSSFEAIINNWTTTYLAEKLSIDGSRALYALSLYVVGMAVMRLLLGSVFRNVSARRILVVSFLFLLAGCLLLNTPATYSVAVAGMVCIGIGLAAGFPVMLGFVGNLYADVSGTAFSIVLTIALVGNMLVNFIMGVIAGKFGVEHLTTVAFVLLSAMLLLSIAILKKTKLQHV